MVMSLCSRSLAHPVYANHSLNPGVYYTRYQCDEVEILNNEKQK